MLVLNAAAGKTFFRGLVIALVAGGCGGGGCNSCGGMEPIPGGFPAEDRTPNAIQLRITDSAFTMLEADPAALVGPLLGEEGLTINVPASCGSDPEICCNGGVPAAVCGPLEVDLALQEGDLPRLEIMPIQGAQRVDLVIRTRIRSTAPIAVSYLGIDCDVGIDTADGSRDGISIIMDVLVPQDPDELTTRLDVGSTSIDFENDDISIDGGFLCAGVDIFLKGFIVDLLTEQMSDAIGGTLSDQSCIACESGTTADCGAFADSCADDGLCMIGDRCEQRLGIAGRMTASGIFGGFSSGQLGRMDIYDVAGGYTETDDDGVSMGMYSGALPIAEDRDRCGPSAAPPPDLVIPQSPFFDGNTRPDTGAAFHVGIGIHQQTLDDLAYAAYESGSLCLNLTPGSVDLLTTDGLAPLLMPSVVDLLHGKNSPIVMALRPQEPPSIAIGPGTTMEGPGGETIIVEPLLDVLFDDMEIDFFVVVDDQFIRVMTLTADLHLPMNLEINEMGEIEPVLDDSQDVIGDTHVTNAEALRETNEELEEKVPVLLALALPSLLDSLGSFALPSLGGLDLRVADDGILSVEDNAFLAIYADLVLTGAMARVQTEASLQTRFEDGEAVVMLSMSGDGGDLEYAFRIDSGLWSPYTRASEVSLRRDIFAIAADHRIEVRARERARPMSADLSPVVLTAHLGGKQARRDGLESGFHGSQDGQGCSCQSSGASSGWLAALVLLLLMARPRRYAKHLENWCQTSWRQFSTRPASQNAGVSRLRRCGLAFYTRHLALLALAGLSACNCSSDPAGACPDGCLEGELAHGPIGRYSSLATSAQRIVAAGYDDELGDLVIIERNEEVGLHYLPIAGIPDEPPAYEPETYRNGIVGEGPDVGIWTSIALHDNRVLVAYVDADDGSVHLAREQEDGTYLSEVVDEDTGLSGASYLSLSISSSGQPSIAYFVHGIASPDNNGLLSQLRVADGGASWASQVVDVGPVSCGGLCANSEVCVEAEGMQECKMPSGTCDPTCGDTEACIEGVCATSIEANAAPTMLDGVGLFAKLLHLADDSMVVGYYDRILGDVKIATSTGTGFTPAAAYEDPSLDTGMWLSMAAGSDGVHLAFQDATADRLMYALFSEGTLSVPEFVDEGVREGDVRTHPVGASASIVLGRDRAPVIVYQDGLTSDIEIAKNEQGSWMLSTFMSGDRLDGFFIDVADRDGVPWLSHYFYDRAENPMGELEIVALP